VTEAWYDEDPTLTPTSTSVFIRRDDQLRRLGVTAERLSLDGGPPTPVSVSIDPKELASLATGPGPVARIDVHLECKPHRGAYRLTFSADDWAVPQTRIVNFGL
jgi:hypothetical protein